MIKFQILPLPSYHSPITWLVLPFFFLYVFSFSAELSTAIGNISLGFLLVFGLIWFFKESKAIAEKDLLLYLSISFLFYIAARTFWAGQEWPHQWEQQWDAAKGWLLTGFLTVYLISFWVSKHKNPNNLAVLVFLLFALGFTFSILPYFEFQNLIQIINGKREQFGFAGTEAGLYSAFGIILVITLTPFVVNLTPPKFKIYLVFTLIALVSILLFALLATKARGAWLGFVLALSVSFVLFIFSREENLFPKKDFSIVLTAFLTFLMVLMALQSDKIYSRITSEGKVISQIIEEGVDKAEVTSISKRVLMWRWGINRWMERPWFGWGPRNLHFVAKKDPIIEKVPKLTHLHNTFIEILVRFGVVGFAFFFFQWILIFNAIRTTWQKSIIPPPLANFLIAGWVLWVVWSFFAFRLNHPEMSFFIALLGGVPYGIKKHSINHTKNPSPNPY
ncbi:O-antigen ligase family protein [Thiohalorhabdus denitrificans]|uniref:O-antigen ligase n=1 Tax=Thiohalorhabdus denitrificans TaxID=381306 RepID=A0A1G5AF63_9GAMM|nr:O-antigen ligase family protein [Thiohalorhabdus denitrificans]SCX76515.1 O-antigen ligase [Thiohalorhabdus denitrificans]